MIYGFKDRPTNEDIAEMLGIRPVQLNRYYKSKNLQRETVQKILNTFKVEENEIWGTYINNERIEPYVSTMERHEEYLKSKNSSDKPKQEVTPIPYEDYMMVEYVDLSASAGPLGGSNVDILPEKKKRLVPKEFDNGNYLVVRVDGDSMVDGTMSSIPDGTEILVKEHVLENGDKLPIRGNLFVICSSEGNVFKQIVEHNTEIGYIRCHSYNPKYPDYNIPLNEVHQIFVYKKIVSYRPSIPEIK